MNAPTQDSPSERDAKADALEQERITRASDLRDEVIAVATRVSDRRVKRALKLEHDREVTAADLARKLYFFRWEMRVMYLIAIALAVMAARAAG